MQPIRVPEHYVCHHNGPREAPMSCPQERCCFYANKSGIVRDKIKKLQEDLVQRRKELFENQLWSGLNGLLPYLLPILGPLVGFLLILTFDPWAFRKITDLVKQQIDSALAKPIQVHYQRLEMADRWDSDYQEHEHLRTQTRSFPTGTAS